MPTFIIIVFMCLTLMGTYSVTFAQSTVLENRGRIGRALDSIGQAGLLAEDISDSSGVAKYDEIVKKDHAIYSKLFGLRTNYKFFKESGKANAYAVIQSDDSFPDGLVLLGKGLLKEAEEAAVQEKYRKKNTNTVVKLPPSVQRYVDEERLVAAKFVVGAFIAHELAHLLQHKLKLQTLIDNRYGSTFQNRDVELNADFMAGWALSRYPGDSLFVSNRSVNSAQISTLVSSEIGDRGDFDDEDPDHHGDFRQRNSAFSAGFMSPERDLHTAFIKGIRFISAKRGFMTSAAYRASHCACISAAPCDAYGRASTIFIGRVLGGDQKIIEQKGNSKDIPSEYESGNVRFSVEEVFKGIARKELVVSFPGPHVYPSCHAFGVSRDEKYLVYAYSGSEGFGTGRCSRTRLVADAAEDIEMLRNLPKEGTGGKIIGEVYLERREDYSTPLSGMTVYVTNDRNERIETTTSVKGQFIFSNIKPGQNEAEVILPAPYTIERSKVKISVVDRACTTVRFSAKIESRVSGLIRNATGKPASILFQLIPVDPESTARSLDGYSDEVGYFEMRGVPPGNYLLRANVTSSANSDGYYYPGTMSAKLATVITVASGAHVGGINLQLPPLPQQMVSGKVVWSDGCPAARVYVFLSEKNYREKEDPFAIQGLPTDSQGRFTLRGNKGTAYWVQAHKGNGPNGDEYSAAFPVILEHDIGGIRLVLVSRSINGCVKRQKLLPK